ncbi:MAG: ELM1/GtrOC1 family putative glycosyltransferase [Wenzhouxiangellaceae bacterium]
MPLIAQRMLRGLTPFLDPYLTPALREQPEKIILGVRPGHRPSDKPPVRIFLGSERKQFRAERVFIWSVEKHRDPSRIYEIHLLKGLKGYVSGFWVTGFTNYRFAIPYFCNYQGRAIYNDVDQVWLTDPAELFDREMGDAGFLSINDHDTSVMLIDCQRMAGVWNRENVTGTTRKRIEARARAAGLWGPMDGKYNARDAEYQPGVSACVHFTTLHTQPWRPFPDWFVYHENPTGSLWFDLEDEANRVAFLPVSALRPSSGWPQAVLRISALPDGPQLQTLLGPNADDHAHVSTRRIHGLLERVPDADLPWVLHRLFRTTDRLEVQIDEPVLITRNRPRRPLHFWIEQFRLASRLTPHTSWRLVRRVGGRRSIVCGGPLAKGPVVALLDGDPGADRETRNIAAALARHDRREWTEVHCSGSLRALRRLLEAQSAAIVVACGRRAMRRARAAVKRASQPPALVLGGRRAGRVPEHAGVVLSLAHYKLPPHPNRIVSLLGIGERSDQTADTGPQPGDGQKSAVLLIGRRPGDSNWTPEELQTMLDAARKWAQRRNAPLAVQLSSEAGIAADRLDSLADGIVVHAPDLPSFTAGNAPVAAWLVAGGDVDLYREVLATGRPVWLMPWLDKPTLAQRMAARIARRAFRPEYNSRGSIRPQQGLTYLCARLIDRALVLPPAGLDRLQQTLVDAGLATWMSSEATPGGRYRDETEAICSAVYERLSSERLQPASQATAHQPGEA